MTTTSSTTWPVWWMYCPKCFWQADEPNSTGRHQCPDCGHSSWVLSFTSQEWDKFEQPLRRGDVQVAKVALDPNKT